MGNANGHTSHFWDERKTPPDVVTSSGAITSTIGTAGLTELGSVVSAKTLQSATAEERLDASADLRSPSAILARLAGGRLALRTLTRPLGSNRRPPEPHYTQVIRQITGDARFHSGFGENFPESESRNPGIQGGYVVEKALEAGQRQPTT